MKFVRSFILISLFVFCQLTLAEPYYDWIDGYDGTEPNTLGLWQFEDTYTLYSGTWLASDEDSGHGATFKARIANWSTTNNADFIRPGKFGSNAANNLGGVSGTDEL